MPPTLLSAQSANTVSSNRIAGKNSVDGVYDKKLLLWRNNQQCINAFSVSLHCSNSCTLMKVLRPFLIALQFLTRLPVRLRNAPNEFELGYSVVYYPLVGMVIGAFLGATLFAASMMHVPNLLAAAIALAVWALVTGGLHLDGLADSTDAWAGGRGDRERTLTIMKDPHCGPMAVIAIVIVLLIKFAALAVLIQEGRIWQLALAPLLGRVALPLLFLTTPYVRAGGIGAAMFARLPRKTAMTAIAFVCIAALILFRQSGLVAIEAGLAMFFLVRRSMMKVIGGTTGDTAGATVELIETVVIVAAVCLN
jgi:adenosylcobinamide-GDP ribazoletransferase